MRNFFNEVIIICQKRYKILSKKEKTINQYFIQFCVALLFYYIRQVFSSISYKQKLIRNVGKCFLFCKEFEEKVCERLIRSPYCCNGCPKKSTCIHRKKYYKAEHAHNDYKFKMSDSRKEILLSEEETLKLEKIITTPIICGQSIHHVCSVYKDEIPVCEKTIYNYIDSGVFELKNIDLVRKVRYKLRKRPIEHKIHAVEKTERTRIIWLTHRETTFILFT